MVDDADLVKEVVYSLLSAKGGATSTQQVQVAINSSLPPVVHLADCTIVPACLYKSSLNNFVLLSRYNPT